MGREHVERERSPQSAPDVGRNRESLHNRLEVGAVHAPEEQAADRLAADVTRILARATPTFASPASGGRIRRSAAPPTKASANTGVGMEGGAVDDVTAGEIGRIRRGGARLQHAVRSPMERAFGTDLGSVRIHTGAAADAVSRSLNAAAFTIGSDVVFRNGEFDPGSRRGQHVLAHELAHVVAGDSTVHRLWGFGNTGRTLEEEDDAIGRVRSTPDDVATKVRNVLRPEDAALRSGDYAMFNSLFGLLARTDVKSIANKYKGAPLVKDIDDSFGAASFRAQYLRGLVNNGGLPPPLLRVRMALGAGGKGAAGFTSDQAEALRLIETLPRADLITLFKAHDVELRTGLSSKAYEQVAAMRDQYKAVPPAASPAGSATGGTKLEGAAALKFLQAADRSLGKIVSRAKKGESTAFYDKLTVKATVNKEQLIADVKTWVQRAIADEQLYFGGKPLIRQYVLGQEVTIPPTPAPARGGAAPAKERGSEFITRMESRQFLVGWNDGDRLMVRLLIGGGTGRVLTTDAAGDKAAKKKDLAAATRQTAVGLQPAGQNDNNVRVVQAAALRASDPVVIAAFSALASEIITNQQRTARNRSDRAITALLKVPTDKSDEFLGALLTGDIDPNKALDSAAISTAMHQLFLAMQAAGIAMKEQSRIVARLKSAWSSDGYAAMRRYAFKSDNVKGGFKPLKFAQLVAGLSPEELVTAKADVALVERLASHRLRGDDPLTKAALARSKPAAAAVVAPATEWAQRWSLFIVSSKSEKKIYSFALEIYNDGGSTLLKDTYAKLDATAKAQLDGYGLGAALKANKHIGAGGYDLVGKIMSKAGTARPGGAADVDTIASTFESLSGDRLLDEWTNIADYKSTLDERKAVLTGLETSVAKLEDFAKEIAKLKRRVSKKQGIIDASTKEHDQHDQDATKEEATIGQRSKWVTHLEKELSFDAEAGRLGGIEVDKGADPPGAPQERTLQKEIDKTKRSVNTHTQRRDRAVERRKAAKKTADKATTRRDSLTLDLTAKEDEFNRESGNLDLAAHHAVLDRIDKKLASSFRLRMREDRRQQLNTGVKQLTTGEYFAVATRLADHIAAGVQGGPTQKALMERGLLPHELKTAGESLQLVTAQTKEANTATWAQWQLFTVRGQLREESSSVLTRQFENLEQVAADPTRDIDAAKTDFDTARDELTERTKSFEETAKKYAARVKKLVELILDVVIIGATLGIGALPVAINAAVQAAMALGKELIVAVIDKTLMPSESNLLTAAGIATAKAGLKAGLAIGVAQIDALLRYQLNMVDSRGLSGGNYIDAAGHTTTSSALDSSSAEYVARSIAVKFVTGPVSKLGTRLIDATIDAATTGGADAWKKLVTDWKWQDAIDTAFGPFLQEAVEQARWQVSASAGMTAGTVQQGATEYTMVTAGAALGGQTAADSSLVVRYSPTFWTGVAPYATDRTVFAFLDYVAGLPGDEIERRMATRRQAEGSAEVEPTESSAPAHDATTQARLWEQLAKVAKATHTPPVAAKDLVAMLLKIRKKP